MSRIIKATRLVFTFPKLIEYQCEYQDEENSSGELKGQDFESFDSQEAQAIIAETEEMVQQLLNEAKVQAEKIITEAKAEAQAILREGWEKVEVLHKEAEKAGFEAGYAAGQQALADEWEKFHAEVATSKLALEEERLHLIERVEAELIHLAVNIARKIIHAELDLSPKKISAIAKATLDQALEGRKVTLKVHSSDYNYIVDFLEKNGQEGKGVKVEVDNTIASRGCIVETSFGIVDGTVEGQIREVTHDLFEVSQSD